MTAKSRSTPEDHPDAVDQTDRYPVSCHIASRTASHTTACGPAPFGRALPRPVQEWITDVLADDLPTLHSFVGGLQRDRDPVTAGLTLP